MPSANHRVASAALLACAWLGGCAALQPPAGPLPLKNPGFEDEHLSDSGDGSWHFRVRHWNGARHGVMNPAIAQFKSGGAPEGRNSGFLSQGGSSISQVLDDTLLPNRSYELQLLVGRRLESSFGAGEYVLELYAGNQLLASKPGETPPAGEFVVDTLRYSSEPLLTGPGGRLKVQVRNLNARMINLDDVRLYSWNRAEPYRPPPLTYQAVASTEGCIARPEAAWRFPHVAYPHGFERFNGIAGAATVSQHAALSSVYELEVIDDKWLFERGFNCDHLLGTHPLDRRTPSTLVVNTIDDTLRYVVLPHNQGNGSRIEIWANGQQLHSADIGDATAWTDRTVDLPPGTTQVTLRHHATGWQLEHLFWQYLGPADPARLAAVAPMSRPMTGVATYPPPAPPVQHSTLPAPRPATPAAVQPPVPAAPEPTVTGELPRHWHMRVEPVSDSVPIDAGLRAFWDRGVYVFLRDDGQIGFNPDDPSPYFYQGVKRWQRSAGHLSLDLDGMRYVLALPDRLPPGQTVTTLDENGRQFRMLLTAKRAGQR